MRWNIACHEMGHAFGLLHVPESEGNGCMNNGAAFPDHVGQHGWDDLNELYSHITASNPNG